MPRELSSWAAGRMPWANRPVLRFSLETGIGSFRDGYAGTVTVRSWKYGWFDFAGLNRYFAPMNRVTWIASVVGILFMALGAEAPMTFSVGGLTFKRPEKWAWVESTLPMRKAQLTVPAAETKAPGEVVFFHFGPGNGGGTQANVDRWLGQFQEKGDALKSKVEEVTVRGRKITFVRAQGTYLSGTPGGPKTPQPDSVLLGAIVEGPDGAVFIRFTGPSALGTIAEPEFRKLAESGAT